MSAMQPRSRWGFAKRVRASAFTLIELLVVVAIIALLISILLPSLSAAKEQTRQAKCLSNLKQMGVGLMLYANNHLGTLPGPLHPPIYRETGDDLVNEPNPMFPPMDEETQRPWFLLSRLAPLFTSGGAEQYLEYVDEVATCPTGVSKNPDSNFQPSVNGNPNWSRPFNYLPNTYSNTSPNFYFGWVNTGVTWTGFVNFRAQGHPSYQDPKPIEQVRWPADEWAIGDAWWDFRRVLVTPGNFRNMMLGTWQVLNNGNAADSSANPLLRAPYHGNDKYTNLMCFDGHGEKFTGKDEWGQHFPKNWDKKHPSYPWGNQ